MAWSSAKRALILGLGLLAACSSPGSGTDGGPGGRDSGAPGGTDAGSPCSGGLTFCGGSCTDTSHDGFNCGACGHTCAAGQTCQSSSCQQAPDCRQTPCPSGYYCDLNSGECNSGCAADNQCPQPGTCNLASHQCSCNSGYHNCSGACVQEGIASCGTSCAVCEAPANATATCTSGTCGFGCNGGYHECAGTCASDGDATRCGSACVQCPGDPNGSAVCTGGSCGISCGGGYHLCSGACASDTDPNQCGSSCVQCPGTANGSAVCTGGSCGIQCDANYVSCSGGCCADCRVSGCTGFTWCDTTTGLCQSGCATNDQCASAQVCCTGTHVCQNTVDSTCPQGYQYFGQCSDGTDWCVSSCVPPGTYYPFNTPCDAGYTDRGDFYCSGTSATCVPN